MSLKRPTQEYVLTEVKIDAVKPNISLTGSGSYAGDSSVNRAIPHGLGVVPKYVVIGHGLNGIHVKILPSGKMCYTSAATTAVYDLTAADSTNIYVGNATSYGNSMNGNTVVYYWVVFA